MNKKQDLLLTENQMSILSVHNLWKHYNGKNCVLKNLSFSVGFNECFGLLGLYLR